MIKEQTTNVQEIIALKFASSWRELIIIIYLNLRGCFTPTDSVSVTVTNITSTGKMCKYLVLPVRVPVKKIKGAASER